MTAEQIQASIKKALPDAQVSIKDLRGDGDHYDVVVISQAFADIPRVKQHQMVYKALSGAVGTQLHAMALTTKTP